MPLLRERRDDVPLLAEPFLHLSGEKNKRVVTSLSSEAIAYLWAYDWPGNVREIENAIEYAVFFGWSDQVMPEDLWNRSWQERHDKRFPSSIIKRRSERQSSRL